jgi:PAS domain-containing protein
VLVVCNDVTEAHRATEALRENKERLQLALDAGVVGIWDWHIPEDRVFADARFAGLYGVDPALAAAGAPVNLFLRNMHRDDRERVNRETALACLALDNKEKGRAKSPPLFATSVETQHFIVADAPAARARGTVWIECLSGGTRNHGAGVQSILTDRESAVLRSCRFGPKP